MSDENKNKLIPFKSGLEVNEEDWVYSHNRKRWYPKVYNDYLSLRAKLKYIGL